MSANLRITKDFTYYEIACRRTGLLRITPRVIQHMELLQTLRDWWGGRLQCAGYRTPLHNALEGGAGNSQHLLFPELTIGQDDRFATDITPMTLEHGAESQEEAVDLLAMRADQLGFTGIGVYRTFLHLDCRPKKARWSERG